MLRELEKILADATIDLDAIAARGGSAWIFGSRANNCAHADSDWDILVVDSAVERPAADRVPQCARVDLVYVDSCVFERWCGSELATHIADYGCALISRRKITARPMDALPRKLQVTRERAATLQRLWRVLHPARQERELTRLRRDAQRAWNLQHGLGVPPTALLDAQWSSLAQAEKYDVLGLCGASLRSRHERVGNDRAAFEMLACT